MIYQDKKALNIKATFFNQCPCVLFSSIKVTDLLTTVQRSWFNLEQFDYIMDTLRDVINMLRNTTNPQVEYITRTMKKWAKENLHSTKLDSLKEN
ncbi:hypothetical protein KUTeg_003683 [Tegillarca granosa]|uniref:Uncharacterized protein n=1 Tax=Tegillarca granosa TaxID=220873 RepID=A0ABQ9FMT5_TEGGR|nr:hypothetical protein KUTeg_003683 [Tegillarca granosa]